MNMTCITSGVKSFDSMRNQIIIKGVYGYGWQYIDCNRTGWVSNCDYALTAD